MSNYFRITAYNEKENISIIIDSNGMFDKLWKFSSFLIQKEFKIIEVGNDESFIDKDEVRIPIHESTTLLAMLSYFQNKAREIQYQTNIFGVVPEHLQDIIGALRTKYDEMKAKEEEEEERKRLIELEKKEREEYERLKKKFGGQ